MTELLFVSTAKESFNSIRDSLQNITRSAAPLVDTQNNLVPAPKSEQDVIASSTQDTSDIAVKKGSADPVCVLEDKIVSSNVADKQLTEIGVGLVGGAIGAGVGALWLGGKGATTGAVIGYLIKHHAGKVDYERSHDRLTAITVVGKESAQMGTGVVGGVIGAGVGALWLGRKGAAAGAVIGYLIKHHSGYVDYEDTHKVALQVKKCY